MINKSVSEPIFNWVLLNQLAIGRPPNNKIYIETLKKNNIKNVLTLCSEKEFIPNNFLLDNFSWERSLLPDHRDNRNINITEIKKTLNILRNFLNSGATYVHCYAAVERSPLICMAWIIKNKGLTINQALFYMMEVHPRSSPLAKHLSELNYL